LTIFATDIGRYLYAYSVSRGAPNPNIIGQKAEIKPVEPDQDNACAGKDRASLLSFPVFVNPA
jgi:hypothetical protein